jgi:hypothetical protein
MLSDSALYYRKHKEKMLASRKRYYEKNKEVIVQKAIARNNAKKELRKIYDSERYKRDRDKILKRSRQYYQQNKEKEVLKSLRYKLRKQKAIPQWLNEVQLKEVESFYLLAKECEMLTGDKYHVDHIVPLKGKNVCGLHVPWNLQVLPAEINLSKNNKFTEGR